MKLTSKYKKAIFLMTLAAGNIAVFSLLWKEAAAWHGSTSPYIAKKIYDKPLQQMRRFSHDGNGEDQLISVLPNMDYPPRTKEILLFSPFQKSYAQVSFLLHLKVPLNHQYFTPLDLDGDRKAEIPFMWVDHRKFQFAVRDLSGKVILSHALEPLSLAIPSDTILFSPITIADIDQDGRFELIWTVSGEFMGLPRGFAVHDVKTGRLKWEFLFGAIPFQTEVVDIDADGRKEVVFSAWAPHNGYEHNGMNDDTSYVGVLSAEGKLLWRREAGGYYTQVHFSVADLDNGCGPEIVTARSCHREINPDPGEICVLDPKDGSLVRRFSRSLTSYTRPIVAEIDGKPGSEIVVGDVSGHISLLDGRLSVRKRSFHGERVTVLAVDEFIAPKKKLIAARAGESEFILLDQNLGKIFQYRNPDKANETIEVLALLKAGRKMLLLNADRPFLVSSNPNQGTVLSLFRRSGFLLVMVLGLAFNAFAMACFRKARDHSRVGSARKVDPGWLTVTQEMLHRMKTPMTNILWEAERLKATLEKSPAETWFPELLKQAPDSLIAELKELKLMNRYLMKFLQIQSPKLKETDLNALIQEEAAKYSRHLQGRIRFDLDLNPKLPPIAADEEQIREAFVNIIENAMDAMPDGGTLRIETFPAGGNRRGTRIVFQDSGMGMSAEQLERVFNPEYTTKTEGFGIGLPLCQRVIEAHGGEITVESRPGIGTKVALFIPWDYRAAETNEPG